MAKNKRQDGLILDWNNQTGAAVSSGDPISLADNRVGVALSDIAVGEAGGIAVEGVWDVPKETGDSYVVGDLVYFDTSDGLFKSGSGATSFLAGYVFAAAAAGTATVAVKINA